MSLLLSASFFLLLRRRHDAAAGALLGCFAYKPQLALGLFAALVGARRFRALASASFVALLLVAASYATLPGATRDYVERAPHFGAVSREPDYPSAGLHGLF